MSKQQLKAAVGATLDLVFWPFVWPAGLLLRTVRRIGLNRLPFCRAALLRLGVLPLRNHYYEPFVNPADLLRPVDEERALPGIDWNIDAQLAFLQTLTHAGELAFMSGPRAGEFEFRLDNGSFESGDAEYLYQVVRRLKPKRIFEIGSGNSTLVVRHALAKNLEEDAAYRCKHVCIEPYEAPWLEKSGVTVVRKRVEETDPQMFRELEQDDLLFIDSSHVIRPQGDVIVEYLQILPILRPGVVVHVHDIFSPRDYPKEWLVDRISLWNEQYLLEAFLTGNASWRVIGALNLLQHRHYEALRFACPHLTPDREPGSFYMRKIA
jgi:hypothetical protein